MNSVKIDLSKKMGKIKPMNCVNNGPTGSKVRRTKGNFEYYQALNIPYARLHDASFYSGYGGEYSVDVHRVFPNFDADENDPKSYLFQPTDIYLQDIESVGTKIFYRLGASIEHGYKKGTYPPKDYNKWARICEHIIRHYTEGWADGFKMDIEYWEIWNEPDCKNADGSNPCWQGTASEFYDFFETVAKYLKSTFPHLKIGGPAFTGAWCWMGDEFIEQMAKRNVPLDFYSFHCYSRLVSTYSDILEFAKNQLVKNGYNNTELHLNEWNYIKGWLGDNWTYSLLSEKGIKGAAFVASVMSTMQKSDLDMLMYYDARPCAMNGLFEDITSKPLKTYYTFKAFDEVKQLGESVYSKSEEDVYVTASCDGNSGAIMVSRYDDDDTLPAKDILVEVRNNYLGTIKAEFYLLNKDNDLILTKEEYFTSNDFNIRLKMENHSLYLIKLIKE